jgi:hypothetical protein
MEENTVNVLSEQRKLRLESPVKVTINDLTITGAKKREAHLKMQQYLLMLLKLLLKMLKKIQSNVII